MSNKTTAPKAPVARPQKPAVQTAAPVAEKAAVATPAIEIESGIAMPAITRKSAKSSVYPFDALQVNQSFFVAETVKKMASVVASATKRYSVPVEGKTRTNRKGEQVQLLEKTRVFEIRNAEKDGVQGCRVFRTK